MLHCSGEAEVPDGERQICDVETYLVFYCPDTMKKANFHAFVSGERVRFPQTLTHL